MYAKSTNLLFQHKSENYVANSKIMTRCLLYWKFFPDTEEGNFIDKAHIAPPTCISSAQGDPL